MTIKTDFYLAIWRKAQAAPMGAPLTVPCASHKAANAFRLRLYVAIRPYRNDPGLDSELYAAANQCEAIIKDQPDGSAELVVRPAWMNETLIMAAAALGISFGPAKIKEEAEASMQRFMEAMKLEQGAEPKAEPGDLFED